MAMHNTWKEWLKLETAKPYFTKIGEFIRSEIKNGKTIYPPYLNIFNAFSYDPEKIKLVILGQDPYFNPGEAHGLSFSVLNKKVPSSLRNIYKEITNEGFILKNPDGNLTHWAEQGIFLLNSVLSVEQGKAGSHSEIGWQAFTDYAIKQLSEHQEHVVFLLWGAYAKKKEPLIDSQKHLILTSPHPSGLSAHRGFIGNNHFKQANDYLVQHGKDPIQW